MAKTNKAAGQPFFVDPCGKIRDFSFAVLRSTYNGVANTTTAYAERKVRLCTRSDMLLPPGAPDAYSDPRACWRAYEASRLPAQRDLMVCVTVYRPGASSIHEEWELVRAFARETFSVERKLPVHAILHAPGLAGSRNDVHGHLLVSARELMSFGFGAFAATLCRDEGQREVHDAWTSFLRRWSTGGAGR
jgi:hypothetical protein